SEFGIAAMKLSNLACASHFAICIESIENLMLISNDEDHVDVGSIYKNKTLLFLLLENWVTSIGIKETEEDTDPRKRNETLQCEEPPKLYNYTLRFYLCEHLL
ncbi:hypothetical protein Anas_13808, partial [Armadillidium nasatum]